MAQTYQMKHNVQGTIYSLLTVESDGRMTIAFHGTDREICHEVTENADGWLCYSGAMYPGLQSGKWQLIDDGRGKMEDVVETTEHAEQAVVAEPQPTVKSAEQEPLTVNHEPLTVNRQTSSTLKAVGMVAAATVALFVIYETGLLIPLGLIGLATGGLLK